MNTSKDACQKSPADDITALGDALPRGGLSYMLLLRKGMNAKRPPSSNLVQLNNMVFTFLDFFDETISFFTLSRGYFVTSHDARTSNTSHS